MIDAQPHSGHVSLLNLEIHPHENPDWPVVRILVDGADPFETVAPGWRGFDPDDILGPRSPLLPGTEDRRVAVHRCSCGEAGCGVIAPIITPTADENYILWCDFRNYAGEFFRPLPTNPDADLTGLGRRWDLPDLRFDARQYVAEIARSSQDRTWETPRRQTARLLRDQLMPLRLSMSLDMPLRGVVPAWEGEGIVLQFGREYDDGLLDQQELRLTSTHADPAHAALDMTDQLLSTPQKEWHHRFADENPSESD